MTKQTPPVILLIATLIFNCSDEKTDTRTTVTFWHSFVSTTRPALAELIRKFETENPDLKIREQYIPTGDALIQKLVAAIQSQSVPDVAWIHADFMDKLVQADAIYDMARFIEGPNGLSAEDLADIFPELLKNALWRGRLYALPMEATALGLFYNKDLFRQAGLDPNRPPQTWDELRDYAHKLTVDRDGDGAMEHFGFYIPGLPASGALSIWMTLQWTPYLWQAGGVEINSDQTEVLFNSEAGVQALTLWKNLYDELNIRNFSMTHDLAFASGTAAMIMDGPWDLPRFREINKFEWGVAPLPAGPARQVTYLAGEHLAIFKQSPRAADAWRFVKWVIQPENQALFSMKSGYLPVRQSTLQLPEYRAYLETDAALKSFVEQMSMAESRRPIDFYRVEINQFLAEAIEKATVGGVDPKTALDEAAAKSNALLAKVGDRR
jgi:ABC-type glycerol-3-phosphate transport system substrate-binding protein